MNRVFKGKEGGLRGGSGLSTHQRFHAGQGRKRLRISLPGARPLELVMLLTRSMKNHSSLSKAALLMAAATSGMAATSQAAGVYNESINGDLSNSSASPTVLTSGTDEIIGTLIDPSDSFDHFTLSSLGPGGTANFTFSFNKPNPTHGVNFTFRNADTLAVLFSTGGNNDTSGGGTTGALAVPLSGQIRISVENTGSAEGFPVNTSWTVSTADVVPEPSGAALVALGALLALKRRRD